MFRVDKDILLNDNLVTLETKKPMRLYMTDTTALQALRNYGGYTLVNDVTLVASTDVLSTSFVESQLVVVAFEIAHDGSETGLTFEIAESILKALNVPIKTLYRSLGGWLNEQNEEVIEKGLVIRFNEGLTDVEIGQWSEVIRSAFRQHSVLVVDSRHVVSFVSMKGE